MKKSYFDDDFEEKSQTNNFPAQKQFGCGFCWNAKRNQSKELYFLDAANNMRVCLFCPYCGRDYSKGEVENE